MAKLDAVGVVSRKLYWRESDAKVVVDSWRRSGDGLAVFCRRHALKPDRVSRWARRLQPKPVKFHPVELVRQDGHHDRMGLEVELIGGETVRVPSGFELEDLRRVLSALDQRRGC